MIARPFTNQSITGWGISLTSFPSQKSPKAICSIHIKIRVAKRNSTPWVNTREVITTASAPVAPDIIPGRPQNIAVISPTKKAACNHTIGFTHAINEKAIASGTSASATVKPESISVFNCHALDNSEKNFCFLI